MSCGGDRFRGGVYHGHGLHFRTGPIAPSWRELEGAHARLAFRDDPAETTVLVNARCGEPSDDGPLLALTAHLFLTFTDREIMEQVTVEMDGREALHTVMRAKLDGVAKVFDAYVLKKDGCVYDFVSISAPGQFSVARGPFEAFVAGFHTLSDG
jgi:hypothetical protein